MAVQLVRPDAKAENLPMLKFDRKFDIFSFQTTISQFISSLINDKRLNAYEGLNDETFLRELIFNANDALHDVRRLSFWKTSEYYTFNFDKELYIKIILNKSNNTITIRDNGIGMSKIELINQFGNMEKIDEADLLVLLAVNDISTIIGFHSAYLVANKIIVISKRIDGVPYIWESSANESYTIQYIRRLSFSHGTIIALCIKEDQFKYLKESKLKEIIKKYSQFIEYPIKFTVREQHKEEQSENKKSKNKKEKKQNKYTEVEELIPSRPLWKKNPDNIQKDEYVEFYKWLSKDHNEHLAVRHFSIHDPFNYTALIFIPRNESFGISNDYRKMIRFYVKDILVIKVSRKLIPGYMNFIIGVINCTDLSVNIDCTKENKAPNILTNIFCDFLKHIFDFLNELTKYKDKYKIFYEQFSSHIKRGIHKDFINRIKLMQLLRYYTTESGDEMCSLKDYVSRMRDNQKYIYFIHINIIHENIKNNIFVEYVRKHGFEVIYMFDGMDGYIVELGFDGKKFMSITNKDLKFSIDDTEKKEREQNEIKKFENLRKTIKSLLNEVEDITISNRFMNLPCYITTSQYGLNFKLDDYVNSNPSLLYNKDFQQMFKPKMYFEINPDHVIIAKLGEIINNSQRHQCIDDIITILFETSLLSYRDPENPKLYAARIYRMIELLFAKDCFFSEEQKDVRNNKRMIVCRSKRGIVNRIKNFGRCVIN